MQVRAAAPIAIWIANHPEAVVAEDGSFDTGQEAPRSVPQDPVRYLCGCPAGRGVSPPEFASPVYHVPSDVEGSYVASVTAPEVDGMERIVSMGCHKEGAGGHHEDPSSGGGRAGR